MPDDIEKRLQALEKKAQINIDNWKALLADLEAITMMIEYVAEAVCKSDPKQLRPLIAHLQSCENDARILNAHAPMILRFQKVRKDLERMIGKGLDHSSPPKSDGEPQPSKSPSPPTSKRS